LLKRGVVTRGPRIPADAVYIDGKDINGLSTAVIRDRRILAEDGMVSVSLVIDAKENKMIVPPTVHTLGFVYKDSQELISHTQEKIIERLNQLMANRVTFGELKSAIRETVGKYLFLKTQRNPMIIPVIMNRSSS
jgi:ribonuclease J